MKYIVAVSVMIVCTMTGFKKAQKLTLRVEELTAIVYFLNFFERQLTYFESSVVNIIRMFSAETISESIGFIKECEKLCESMDFPEAWKTSVNNSNLHTDENVNMLLCDFAGKIGTSDAETQIKYINYYLLRMESFLEKAQVDETNNKKLYIILGFTLGLISAIMII